MTSDDLTEWRKRYGLTQKALARELGLHPVTLTRWTKQKPPKWLATWCIGWVYDRSLREFAGRD